MSGKPRGKEGSEAVLTFRLPRTLHEKLKEAAGVRSVSEEMRQRLEASFQEPADPLTMALLAMISAIVDYFSERPELASKVLSLAYPPVGSWHEDALSFAAMERSIQLLLSALRPGEVSTDDATAAKIELLSRVGMAIAIAKSPSATAQLVAAMREAEEDGK